MRLNPDCIRAILLTVEEQPGYPSFLEISESEIIAHPRFAPYLFEDIFYHVNQCAQSGLFIDYQEMEAGSVFQIFDLSPYGHEFLANIRDDKIWNGVKDVALKVGSPALSAIIQIASNVVTELIKAHFMIP